MALLDKAFLEEASALMRQAAESLTKAAQLYREQDAYLCNLKSNIYEELKTHKEDVILELDEDGEPEGLYSVAERMSGMEQFFDAMKLGGWEISGISC